MWYNYYMRFFLEMLLVFLPVFIWAQMMSPTQYADYLAKTIDDVVKSIHATVPNSKITHADILAILCMEQQSLNIGKASNKGAQGLTQVMPQTFNDYLRKNIGGFAYFVQSTGCKVEDLSRDVRCSIEAGARIFNYYLIKYNGDRTKAAIAYNGGPGRVNSSKLPKETYEYAFLKLPACLNPTINGREPVGTVIWKRLVQKVKEITGGKMALLPGQAQFVPYTVGSQPFDSFIADAAKKPSILDKLLESLGFKSTSYNLPDKYSLPQNYSLPEKTSFQEASKPSYEYDSPQVKNNELLSSNFILSDIDSGAENLNVNLDNSADANRVNENLFNYSNTYSNAFVRCEPKIVQKGAPVLLSFYCPETHDFETLNFESVSRYGINIFYPNESTEYKMKCSKDNYEYIYSCKVEVIDPQINLTANPSDPKDTDEYILSWTSKDTKKCSLYVDKQKISDDLNGRKVVRKTGEKDNIELICETLDLMILKKELSI